MSRRRGPALLRAGLLAGWSVLLFVTPALADAPLAGPPFPPPITDVVVYDYLAPEALLAIAQLHRTDQEEEKAIASLREGLMRTIARISESRNQVHQIEIAVEKCEFYLGKLGDSARKASDSRNQAQQRLEFGAQTGEAHDMPAQLQFVPSAVQQ